MDEKGNPRQPREGRQDLPYTMGGSDLERVQAVPSRASGEAETAAQRAERERRAACDCRPCGGFMLGGNGMGSGN